MHADPGLPPPPSDLFTPWTSPAAAAACAALLDQLHSRARPLPPPSRALRSSSSGATATATSPSSSGGSLAMLPPHVVSEQDLLLACLPYILSYDPWVCPKEEDAAGGQGRGSGGGSGKGLPGQQGASGAGAAGQRRGGLRGVLIQKHVQSLEEGPITPYGGPGNAVGCVVPLYRTGLGMPQGYKCVLGVGITFF